MQHNVVHVINSLNGHINSTDCWCEPSHILLMTNRYGIKILVVEHHDENSLEHRLVILSRRERDREVKEEPNRIDAAWITRELNRAANPPLLPPHDPNERSI